MRAFNYTLICLSCVLGWFAYAFRPLENLLSKKTLRKKSIMRALSGLFQSVSAPTTRNFSEKDLSLKMTASSYDDGKKEGVVLFDTNSFLSWFFASKKPSENVETDEVVASDSTTIETNGSEFYDADNKPPSKFQRTSNSKASSNKLQRASNAKTSPNSAPLIAGYIDFDPFLAAKRIHSTNQRSRRTSWFDRSA